MQDKGCDSFILDLRNNPGGLVRAGLDIARLWLPGEAAILTVEGRDQNGTAAAMQVSLAQRSITHRAISLLCCNAVQHAWRLSRHLAHDKRSPSVIVPDFLCMYVLRNKICIADITPYVMAFSVAVCYHMLMNWWSIMQVSHIGLDSRKQCAPAESGPGSWSSHDNCPLGSIGQRRQCLCQ